MIHIFRIMSEMVFIAFHSHVLCAFFLCPNFLFESNVRFNLRFSCFIEKDIRNCSLDATSQTPEIF